MKFMLTYSSLLLNPSQFYVLLQVYIPVSAPVGIWRLNVRTSLADQNVSSNMVVHFQNTDIFVLFNPWCKGTSSLDFIDDKLQQGFTDSLWVLYNNLFIYVIILTEDLV